MGVDVKIDGLFLLVGGVAAGVTYAALSGNLQRVLNKVNPASSDNLVYQGVGDLGTAVGVPDIDARGVPVDDYVFELIDKLNPFNESDTYAEYVLSGRDTL